MRVIFYDIVNVLPLGNSTRMNSLGDLLALSDFVTLHVPATEQTRNMITAKEIQLMKKGSYLLNASRGSVMDLNAVAQALKSGYLAGVYADVYPVEPESNTKDFVNVLQNCPNTILTPHIGGSTEEAQRAIAEEVSNKIIQYLTLGSTMGSTNLPNVQLERSDFSYTLQNHHRIITIHLNKPKFMKVLNAILEDYNITDEILSTKGPIGICLLDVEDPSHNIEEFKKKLLSLVSIKTRVLF